MGRSLLGSARLEATLLLQHLDREHVAVPLLEAALSLQRRVDLKPWAESKEGKHD